MKTLEISDFYRENIKFRDIEVFPEIWTKRKSFLLYESTPRPCSAVFFVCSDIKVRFVSVRGDTVEPSRGDVVYIPRGACYSVFVSGSTGEQIDTYTVNFNSEDESGDEVLLSGGLSVIASRSDGLFELYAKKLSDALHGIGGERNFLRINAEMYSLFDLIVGSVRARSDAYYPIRQGAEALMSEWNKNEKIEKYAAMCGISNAYFYRCFRDWSGKSPVEYRNLLRLSNAESMLRLTDMRVNEISDVVGYDDPFYFCRIFAKHFGMSPQSYRRAFRDAKSKQ